MRKCWKSVQCHLILHVAKNVDFPDRDTDMDMYMNTDMKTDMDRNTDTGMKTAMDIGYQP
jgi:hypothetical protein